MHAENLRLSHINVDIKIRNKGGRNARAAMAPETCSGTKFLLDGSSLRPPATACGPRKRLRNWYSTRLDRFRRGSGHVAESIPR